MRTEYTRQTRWAHPPEVVDPASLPPGAVYVKQMIWVPCNRCDLQVHATHTQQLGLGITCLECGTLLTPPPGRENHDLVDNVVQQEDQFRAQLRVQEV